MLEVGIFVKLRTADISPENRKTWQSQQQLTLTTQKLDPPTTKQN